MLLELLCHTKCKESNKYVFVPDGWLQMTNKGSKYFSSVKMANEKFVSVKSMYAFMKDNVKGIQTIQWFHFDKKQALQISLKRH
jgi:hypothetical protein